MDPTLRRYQVMSYVVGHDAADLLTVCIILRHWVRRTSRRMAHVVAQIHGLLYMVYLVTVADGRRQVPALGRAPRLHGLSGFVPFLAFFVEHSTVQRSSRVPARRTERARVSGEPLARAPGHRLRPPGGRVGGALVDPPRHRARPRGRRHGDRARRPRHRRRRARRLPRRHGRPHDGRRRARSPRSRSPSSATWTTPTGSSRAADVDHRPRRRPTTRSGAGRRRTARFGIATLARCSSASPGWC